MKKLKIPKNTQFILGCDSDTRNQAYAVLDLEGNCVNAFTVKSDGSEYDQAYQHRGIDRILYTDNTFAIVEGQVVYKNDKKSNPADLIRLARASGIACAYLYQSGVNGIYVTPPSEWKGTAQKHAKQADIIRKMGLTPKLMGGRSGKYCVPEEGLYDLKATQLKHVIDAVGIAQWGLDQLKWQLKKDKINGN